MNFTNSPQKILICTGIYPPKIGGPAQYAKNLKESLEKMGHTVWVKTFSVEDKLPSGFRHLFYFFKILPKVLKSDVVYILDTFSAGLPAVVACTVLGKKSIIRTGGDFLWEQYTERTGKKVLLRNFYLEEQNNFNLKEKIIFGLTKFTLNNASRVVFSTEWQRDIFIKAYRLDVGRTTIVENYYGPKEEGGEPRGKIFVASTRVLKWKNIDVMKRVFDKIKREHQDVELFLDNVPFPEFMEKIKNSYAVVLLSLGDISPNLILDSIRCNKPFICTKEVGILPRIKDAGTFVDPLNESEIENTILSLLEKSKYDEAVQKVRNFNFTHTWEEITDEFLKL